jgi:hypothetical protein
VGKRVNGLQGGELVGPEGRDGNIFLFFPVSHLGVVMRITFFTEQAAQAAVETWERHGFAATRSGTVVVTDCPTLWAVPIVDRVIGFGQVERFDVLSAAKPSGGPRPDAIQGSLSHRHPFGVEALPQ